MVLSELRFNDQKKKGSTRRRGIAGKGVGGEYMGRGGCYATEYFTFLLGPKYFSCLIASTTVIRLMDRVI